MSQEVTILVKREARWNIVYQNFWNPYDPYEAQRARNDGKWLAEPEQGIDIAVVLAPYSFMPRIGQPKTVQQNFGNGLL